MIVGERIGSRLREMKISQSELARRVHLDQSTISGLIKNDQRSTTKLHEIARELKTTPAYLAGETDDPDSDAPTPAVLSAAQRELIDIVEHLPLADQAALLHIARSLVGRDKGGTLHAPRTPYRPAGGA